MFVVCYVTKYWDTLETSMQEIDAPYISVSTLSHDHYPDHHQRMFPTFRAEQFPAVNTVNTVQISQTYINLRNMSPITDRGIASVPYTE